MNTLRQRLVTLVMLMTLMSVWALSGCDSPDVAPAGQVGGASAPSPSVRFTPIVGSPEPLASPASPDWTGRAVGIPAIAPTLPVVAGRPSFTEQDVRVYVASHPPSVADPNGPAPVVERVEFLPVEQVESRINHGMSVPKGTLLCLVTISGQWVVPPGLLPPGVQAQGTPNPNTVVYQVYDAQTGNFMAWTSGVEGN